MKVLFIGGPADGEKREMKRLPPNCKVPGSSRSYGIVSDPYVIMNDVPSVTEYTLRKFVSETGEVHHIYVESHIEDLLSYLIAEHCKRTTT